MTKTIKIILTIITMMFINGCTGTVQTPIELIKKPKIPFEQSFPIEIIDENLTEGSRLIRPLESKNLSSVDYIDWDGDGQDEVYAFYNNSESSSCGVMIIKKDDETWSVIAQIEDVGSDISYAEFIDFNNDGAMELIMGYSMPDEIFKSLVVYQWLDGSYQKIYKDSYSYIIVEDIDSDYDRDILLLRLDRNQMANAELLTYTENQLSSADIVKMDEYVNGYYNIVYGKASESLYGLFVDIKIGSKSATNILIYQDGKLSLLFNAFDDENPYRGTIKDYQIKSRDIDNDGIIEIGNIMVSHLYDVDNTGVDPIYLSTWYKWDGSQNLVLSKMNYKDEKDGFTLDFPKRWATEIANRGMGVLKSRASSSKDFFYIYMTLDNEIVYRVFSIEVLYEDQYDNLVERLNKSKARYYLFSNQDGKYYVGYNQTKLNVIPELYREKYDSLLLSEYEARELFRLIDQKGD